jgi:signal peptidase II
VVGDIVDVHWGADHWPAFNVADSAVCVGAVNLINGSRRPERRGAAGRGSEPD